MLQSRVKLTNCSIVIRAQYKLLRIFFSVQAIVKHMSLCVNFFNITALAPSSPFNLWACVSRHLNRKIGAHIFKTHKAPVKLSFQSRNTSDNANQFS